MMQIEVQSFKPVTLEDGPILRSHLSRQQFFFCDYTFINLYTWGETFDVRWQISGNRLWIYSFQRNRMFMPLGDDIGVDDLLQASDAMSTAGRRGDFVFVEQDYVDAHPELSRYFSIEAEPHNSDYIYLTQRLVDLSGSKLAKKKNLIAQFKRLYPDHHVLPLQPEDGPLCLDLAERWCRIRACDRIGFRHETSALQKALHRFDALGLEGVKVLVNGRMAAYTIFSALNFQTADIHFEKFDPLVKGVGQMINWETARACAGRFKYINREQDLGIAGLRQAKKSYDPACILVSYFLRRL